MRNHTTISINKSTKAKAQKRAQQQNLSVAAVIGFLLNEYAEGRISIGATPTITENGFTPEFEDSILEAANEKDQSPAFTNSKDALEYLHNNS